MVSDFMVSVWPWFVSVQMVCFDKLRFSKMQVLFLSFWRYLLVKFFRFLSKLLIFLRCMGNFGYLGLMLVCFAMGGGLERILRSRYHIFPRVTIHVTTLVNILLCKFCTASNALLLIAYYYIGYCMLYYTFSVK